MITNTGKSMIGRYLVNQSAGFAEYLAIGCGTKPVSGMTFSITNKALASQTATLTTSSAHGLSVGDSISVFDVDTRVNGTYVLKAGTTGSTLVYDVTSTASISSTAVSPNGTAVSSFANNTSMGFEMTRVPISSRSFITEDGVSKLVFTAELPTTDRYEITEVGIYPSESNLSPTGSDSRNILLFSTAETWQYHTATTTSSVPTRFDAITNANNDITATEDAFFTNADNALFDSTLYATRINRYERPRFLNNVILMRGDTSVLATSGTNLTVSSGSHIHLEASGFEFDKNSTDDELRLAFSVINKGGIGNMDAVSNVKVLVQFATSEVGSPEYANFAVNIDNGTSAGQWDFPNNRYVVVNKKLSEMYKTSGFRWTDVSVVLIYVYVTGTAPATSDDFYIALDAMRIENLSSFNNAYGLTAYSKLSTSDLQPVLKLDNTANFIEFKSVVDVT
jgi:hypothetical protein